MTDALGLGLSEASWLEAFASDRWLVGLKGALLQAPSDEAKAADDIVREPGARAENEATPAAVLVPIVVHPLGPTVLLTQRTAHLKDHPGQVSFPGGRVEASDASPLHTALRESAEEIGLQAEGLDVLGYLPRYFTGTGFGVTPVVALLRPPLQLQPDAFEVADIFEVPLVFLMDRRNHQPMTLHHQGTARQFLAMPFGERFIWGATAGMLRVLHDRMAVALTADGLSKHPGQGS